MIRSILWICSIGGLMMVGCAEPEEKPVDLADCRADEGDGLEFEEGGYIEGDKLFLNVGYGGGCEEHEFTLCWPSQSFMESNLRHFRFYGYIFSRLCWRFNYF